MGRGTRRRSERLLLLGLASLFGLTAGPLATRPAGAQEPPEREAVEIGRSEPASADASDRVLALREVELADVVRTVAELTGTRFIFDDRLRGRVTLAMPEPVDEAEALELLHAALQLHGFAAVPTPGGALEVLPLALALPRAPTVPSERAGGEASVATVLRLEHADPNLLAATLAPAPRGGIALPLRRTRSVILAGNAAAVASWIERAQELDRAAREVWATFPLQAIGAETAAALLDAVARRDGSLRARALRIWADERSSQLLLRGAPEAVAEARGWIAAIDRPARGGGAIEVIRLRHADPERVAELPLALARGETLAANGAFGNALAGRPFQVAVHAPTRSLLVSGDAETRALVAGLVRAVDRPPAQVRITATVLEVELLGSLEVGFEAFLPLTEPNDLGDPRASVSFDPDGGGLSTAGGGDRFIARITRTPLQVPIVDASGTPRLVLVPRESAVVTANEGEVRTRTVARPQLLATNGEPQEIFVGDDIPIPTANDQASGGPLQTATTVERTDVGTRLRFTPRVTAGGVVRLELELELTGVKPSLAGPVEEVGVTLEKRELRTEIRLTHGAIAVIATHSEARRERIDDETPYLADIPVLGHLARNRLERTVRTNLLVAIEAEVVDAASRGSQVGAAPDQGSVAPGKSRHTPRRPPG